MSTSSSPARNAATSTTLVDVPVVDPLVIDGYLVRSTVRSPDRTAVCDRSRRLTYVQFDEQVTRLARGLADRGVGRGDRVALLVDNSIEAAVALLAAPRLGAVAAPVNTRLTAGEVAYILADLEPTAVVADARHLARLSEVQPVGSLSAVVVIGTEPVPNWLPAVSVDFDACVAAAGPERVQVTVQGHDPAFILYTSGTTGRPKGAVLSHAGYVANCLGMLQLMRMTDRDELRHVGVPMFHSGGLNSLLQQLVLGAPVLITEPGGMAAAELVELWAEHRVATAFLTPTQWAQVCEVPGVRDRGLALRRLVWGASRPPPAVLARMQETFPGTPVFANFGMTETSGSTCSLAPEDAAAKLHTVGRPAGHIQVRVVDTAMTDLPAGQVGEIVYQGPPVLREYWRNPQATAEAFSGGWFHSGDLGTFDQDGFLILVDRVKDMIVSGGENIYASEVEAALSSHPKVAEVVVVGVPHARWVETPRAVVVPVDAADPPTLEELQVHLRPTLASFKKPTSLAVVDSLPRNSMGKLMRHRVRDEQDGARPAR